MPAFHISSRNDPVVVANHLTEQPEQPDPVPPPAPPPAPIGEPEPNRLPDEAPTPNPDESDNPPLSVRALRSSTAPLQSPLP